MQTGLILGMLFLASCLYAVVLEYGERRLRLGSRLTWVTVVVGTAMVLVTLLFLIDWSAWLLVALAFVVAGLPVVGRSLINQLLRDLALESKLDDRP